MANHPVIIVGAGAAGMMCAFYLASAGIRTAILESGNAPGRKLAISGGGHANFSNTSLSCANYLSGTAAEVCEYTLDNFRLEYFLKLLDAWNFTYEQREHGRLFLKQGASHLVRKLERELKKLHGEIVLQTCVSSIEKVNNLFLLSTPNDAWQAKYLVLATGSNARPALAQIQNPWALAKSLGHKIIPARPALTPFLYMDETKNGKEFRALSGISLEVELKLKSIGDDDEYRCWRDKLLFTHNGLSGPAPLQASLFWQKGSSLEINFLPGENLSEILEYPANASLAPFGILRKKLPPRLAKVLLADIEGRKIAELSRKTRNRIINNVAAHAFNNLSLAGINKAEVCAGGVDTAQIDAISLESRLVPGLYLIGEMLNVTGELGGYNLHWAFASAFSAARAIINKLLK